MKQHLQKSERTRLGGKYRTKSPKAKWQGGRKLKSDKTGKVS